MKERTISAIIMLAIFVPIFIIGGTLFEITGFVLALLSLKEFLDIKETKKELPIFIKVISYIFIILIMGTNLVENEIAFQMDFRILTAIFMSYLIPTVLYHDREKFSVNDAFYLIGSILFLAFSFTLLVNVRNISLSLVIYLFSISVITDTYAYLTGLLVGKHKMIPEVSPKKTWEGAFGGTIAAIFISTVFYITVIDPTASVLTLVFVGAFLSVLGQFGDLIFSAIKRYFDKKDFSNLIPGHGGILDRLDSIIFVLLGFMFVLNII